MKIIHYRSHQILYLGLYSNSVVFFFIRWDRHGRDRMVVGFITTYAISAYHH